MQEVQETQFLMYMLKMLKMDGKLLTVTFKMVRPMMACGGWLTYNDRSR